MQKLFSKILVPIFPDKEDNNFPKQVAEIANQFKCDIHLLQLPSSFYWPFTWKTSRIRERVKFDFLVREYESLLRRGLSVQSCVVNGDPETLVTEYALSHGIDMIVLSNTERGFIFDFFRDFDVTRLSKKTNCPVLTIGNKMKPDELKAIVLPVGDSFSIRKIMFATYLAKTCNATIHLLSLSEKNFSREDRQTYFFKTFQLLKNNTNLPIECKTVSGSSIADGAVEYAQHIDAGLIVVNPGTESKHPGLIKRFFSKLVSKEPSVPIMTVS